MKKYIVKCPYCGQNYIVEAREGQDLQWDEESEHSASDGMVSLMKALLGEISINSWALVITIVVIMIVFIILNI